MSRFRFFLVYWLPVFISFSLTWCGSFNSPPLFVCFSLLFPARLFSQCSGFVLWLFFYVPGLSSVFYSPVLLVCFPFACLFVACFCRLLFYSSQFKILFLGILDLSSLKLLSFRLPSPVCLAFGSLFLFSSTCAWSVRFLIRRLMMRCL